MVLASKGYYEELRISYKEGGVDGYIVDTSREQLKNWLESRGFSNKVFNELRENYNRLGILKGIHVEEDFRNQGYGTEFLVEALSTCFDNGAKAIILEVGTEEPNEIDLTGWYESFGFEVRERPDKYPLMVLKREDYIN